MNASFGSVEIFGHEYEEDIVLHVDGRITNRKKKKSKGFKKVYGHTPLSEKELGFLKDEKPEVVYVGTGYENGLPITEKAKKMLSKFKTSTMATPLIVDKIEREKRTMVAILHVTC